MNSPQQPAIVQSSLIALICSLLSGMDEPEQTSPAAADQKDASAAASSQVVNKLYEFMHVLTSSKRSGGATAATGGSGGGDRSVLLAALVNLTDCMDAHSRMSELFHSLLKEVQSQWTTAATSTSTSTASASAGSEQQIGRIHIAQSVADHIARHKLVSLHPGHVVLLETAITHTTPAPATGDSKEPAEDEPASFAVSELPAWRALFDRLYSFLLLELCDATSCQSVAAILFRFVTDSSEQPATGGESLSKHAIRALFSNVPGKGILLHRVLLLIYRQTDSDGATGSGSGGEDSQPRHVLSSFLTQIAASVALGTHLLGVLKDFAREQPLIANEPIFQKLITDMTALAAEEEAAPAN